jgi:glucan biosynthesis protein C
MWGWPGRATTLATPSYHLESKAVSRTSRRRYELDWLRVLIIVGLIPFHVIALFAIAIDLYVTGGQPNSLAELVTGFFMLWPMSLLFLVAGASTWFALGRRSLGRYVGERLLRLFFPFVFATLVLIPLQVYAVVHAFPQLIQLSDTRIAPPTGLHAQESFFEFYPQYLAGYSYFLTHFSSGREFVFWGHLWFVPRLLLFALATLPVLLVLRTRLGRRFTERLAKMFTRPGTTLLLGLAIALPRVSAAALYRLMLTHGYVNWDRYNLAAQLGVFLVCFLLGYLFYASPPLLQAIHRDGPVALALGVLSFALLLTPIGHIASVTQITPGGILINCLRSESEWLLVAGVLSVALHFFTSSNGLLRYLNEAAYPLYVLHMPMLILVGLSILQWNLPATIALPLIAIGTLALTLGSYEFAIKRVAVLRLLFGLKLSHAAPAAQEKGMQRLMPDVRQRPDDHDDGGVAQPVGERRVDEAAGQMPDQGKDHPTHEDRAQRPHI